MAKKSTTKHSDFDRVLAALSYVWVFAFIPYVIGHNKPFVYAHAKQGVALFVIELALILIGLVPILGWIVALAGWLCVAVSSVIGIGHALSGQAFKLPIVHAFVNKKK